MTNTESPTYFRRWWREFRASGPAVVFAITFGIGAAILFVYAAVTL